MVHIYIIIIQTRAVLQSGQQLLRIGVSGRDGRALNKKRNNDDGCTKGETVEKEEKGAKSQRYRLIPLMSELLRLFHPILFSLALVPSLSCLVGGWTGEHNVKGITAPPPPPSRHRCDLNDNEVDAGRQPTSPTHHPPQLLRRLLQPC